MKINASFESLDMDTYLSYIGKTSEEFQEELRPTARERLTRFLVLRKLADLESIAVSPDEIQNEVDTIIESAGDNAEQMRRNLSAEAVLNNIGSSLLNQKLMTRLVDISQGITGDDPETSETVTGDDAAETENAEEPDIDNAELSDTSEQSED